MTLGMLPRTGRLARRSMTPLMDRILAVTHPDLDACLKEHRKQGRADSQGTTEEQEPETSFGEISRRAAAEASDTEPTSAFEGDRSMQEESVAETQSGTSSNASGDASMLAGTGDGESASSSTTQRPLPSLPSTSSGAACICVTKRGRVTFTPGIAAPVPPAALTAECVELLRQLCVGQTALLNAFSDHDKKLGQVVAYMEGIHSDVVGLHRTVQALSSTVTSALQQAHAHLPAQVPLSTPQSVATSDVSDHGSPASPKRYSTRSTQQTQAKHSRPQTPSPQKSRATPECPDKRQSGKTKARRATRQTSGSHVAEASPAKDSPVTETTHRPTHAVSVPTEEVLNIRGTPRKSTGTHPPTTSTSIPSPSKQLEEGTVETPPEKKAKEGTVGGTAGKKAKEGTVGGTPEKKPKEGTVGGTAGKKAKEGTVGGTVGKKAKEGTVGGIPEKKPKEGIVGGGDINTSRYKAGAIRITDAFSPLTMIKNLDISGKVRRHKEALLAKGKIDHPLPNRLLLSSCTKELSKESSEEKQKRLLSAVPTSDKSEQTPGN
ncbi:uncharacterized protein LOC144783266 [Lissotriton helveticus]